MKFSIRFADKIVGTLTLLALAILVVVIFMLGRSQRWFKYDYKFVSYLQSAAGLTVNMDVKYKGFTIGHVKDFKLVEDDSVEVHFTIFDDYISRVREGSLVELVESPIGLGNAFIFYPGKGLALMEEGSVIYEVNSNIGRQMIASGLAAKDEAADSISKIINQVSALLDTVNYSLSGNPGSDEYPIGKILADIGEVTDKLSDPSGTIMRILDGDGPVYRELTEVISSLSGVLDDLNRTTDVIPAEIPVLISRINSALSDLQDVVTAVSNNPLLRGGIPQRAESGTGGTNPRNLEF